MASNRELFQNVIRILEQALADIDTINPYGDGGDATKGGIYDAIDLLQGQLDIEDLKAEQADTPKESNNATE